MDAVVRVLKVSHWRRVLKRQQRKLLTEYRRKDPRYVLPEATAELLFHRSGRAISISGTVLNASLRGLMIQAPERIEVGRQVLIELTFDDGAYAVAGTIRHVTSAVNGHKIGIELDLHPN